MNQGTQGYSLTKKIEGRKYRETVPLKNKNYSVIKLLQLSWDYLQLLYFGRQYSKAGKKCTKTGRSGFCNRIMIQ
jgi:hypothetical protein